MSKSTPNGSLPEKRSLDSKQSDEMDGFWDYANDAVEDITANAQTRATNRNSSQQNSVPKLDDFWDYIPPEETHNRQRTSHGRGSKGSVRVENDFWGYPPVLEPFWGYSGHDLPAVDAHLPSNPRSEIRKEPVRVGPVKAIPSTPFDHGTYNYDFRSMGTQVRTQPTGQASPEGVRRVTLPPANEPKDLKSISRPSEGHHSPVEKEMGQFWHYPEDLEPFWDYSSQQNGDLRQRTYSADNIANQDRGPKLSLEASDISSKDQLRTRSSLPNLDQEAKAFTRPSKFSSARCKTAIKCGGPKDFPAGQNVYYNDGREVRHTVKSKEYSDVSHIKRCVIDQIDFIKQRDGIWSYQRLYRAVFVLANFMKEHKFIYKYLQDSQRQWMEDIAKRVDGWTYLMTPMSCTFAKWRQTKLRRRARAEQMARDCFRIVNPQNYDKQEREKKRANALIHAERMRLKKLDRERKKIVLDRIARLSYVHSRKARQGDQKMPIQMRPARLSDLRGAELFEGALKFRGDWKPADMRRFPHRTFGETLHDLHIAKLFKRGMWGRLPSRPTAVKWGKCSKVSRTSTIKPLTKQDLDPCNAYKPFKPLKRISRPGRLFEYEIKQRAEKLALKQNDVAKEAKALHVPKDEVAKIMDLIDQIEAKHGKITQAKTGHFPPGALAEVIDLIETIEHKQAEINHELLTIRQTGPKPQAKLHPPSLVKARYVKTAPRQRAGDRIPQPRRPYTADGHGQSGKSGVNKEEMRDFWDYPPDLEPYWKEDKEGKRPVQNTPPAPVRKNLPAPAAQRRTGNTSSPPVAAGRRASSTGPRQTGKHISNSAAPRITRTSSRPKTVPPRPVIRSMSPKPLSVHHANPAPAHRPRNVTPKHTRSTRKDTTPARPKSRTKSGKHHGHRRKSSPEDNEPPAIEFRDSLEQDAAQIVEEVTEIPDDMRDFWNYSPNIREFWDEPPDIRPFWDYEHDSRNSSSSRNLAPPAPTHTASSQTSFSRPSQDMRRPGANDSRHGRSSDKLGSKGFQDGIDAAIDEYVDELLRQEFALKAARNQNRKGSKE